MNSNTKLGNRTSWQRKREFFFTPPLVTRLVLIISIFIVGFSLAPSLSDNPLGFTVEDILTPTETVNQFDEVLIQGNVVGVESDVGLLDTIFSPGVFIFNLINGVVANNYIYLTSLLGVIVFILLGILIFRKIRLIRTIKDENALKASLDIEHTSSFPPEFVPFSKDLPGGITLKDKLEHINDNITHLRREPESEKSLKKTTKSRKVVERNFDKNKVDNDLKNVNAKLHGYNVQKPTVLDASEFKSEWDNKLQDVEESLAKIKTDNKPKRKFFFFGKRATENNTRKNENLAIEEPHSFDFTKTLSAGLDHSIKAIAGSDEEPKHEQAKHKQPIKVTPKEINQKPATKLPSSNTKKKNSSYEEELEEIEKKLRELG
jgi:hypothetical protein